MPQLTLDQLPLLPRQSLTLSFNKRTGTWWAVLWKNDKTPDIAADAATPIAALAELLCHINGATITGHNA